MSTSQTMSPEDFIAWATAEIQTAKSEKGEAAITRLDNVRKQVEVAKAFSFEGNVAGLPVEQVEVPAPSSTDVSPDKAQQDDPTSTTATNFDEVAKRLTEDLDTLTKALDGKGGASDGEGDAADGEGSNEGGDEGSEGGEGSGDESDVGKGVEAGNADVPWPDDLNCAESDPTWGSDGESGLGDGESE